MSERSSAEALAAGLAGALGPLVAGLPFPPVARSIQEQAAHPSEPAMQALLGAAREVFGSGAAAWDPLELRALAVAELDPELAERVRARLEERWTALSAVVAQLRGAGALDDSVDDSAAVLHLLAVGIGLALLEPLSPRWSDARSWAALSARLLESLAAVDPAVAGGAGDARMWRARATLAGTPSAVARLMRVLSLLHVDVVTMLVAPSDGEDRALQMVHLMLQAPVDLDRETIAQGISSVSSDVLVFSGLAEDREDLVSRVLRLSASLASDPDAAPAAAAALVLADSWEVTKAAQGADDSALVMRLQWTVQRHVVLRRERVAFTEVERQRASALLALVAALAQARGAVDEAGSLEALDDGTQIEFRLARPEDAEAVAAMHARCSETSVYHRYFTPMNVWREENLRRISGGHRGATLVATDASGEVIALGNVFPIRPDDLSAAEIAVIVEDAWHGRGVGGRMVDRLLMLATTLGFASVHAYVLAENAAMVALLESTGLPWRRFSSPDLGPAVVCFAADLA